eukprot:114767-Hanusia_phi.AAC.3
MARTRTRTWTRGGEDGDEGDGGDREGDHAAAAGTATEGWEGYRKEGDPTCVRTLVGNTSDAYTNTAEKVIHSWGRSTN